MKELNMGLNMQGIDIIESSMGFEDDNAI